MATMASTYGYATMNRATDAIILQTQIKFRHKHMPDPLFKAVTSLSPNLKLKRTDFPPII